MFALFALNGREGQIRDQQLCAVDRFIADLYQTFASRPLLDVTAISESLRRLAEASSAVEGVRLEMDGELFRMGQPGADPVVRDLVPSRRAGFARHAACSVTGLQRSWGLHRPVPV